MASIDYQEAKKEIVKLFKNADNERRIIFWYDAPANFKDDITADNFDCCKVLICDRNEFAIKKTIEHDDPVSNFLVYIPHEKPYDPDNWLLDILMYSEEYYADTIALTMRRLGLTNTDLRRVIEKHSKFFDAEARTKKLNNYIEINDHMSGKDFRMAIMSVLVKASSRSIESVLTELVFDDSEGSKYSELKKYGLEEFLWDEISAYYNYEGDQRIETLIKKFMFTALLEQKADLEPLPSFYHQYIIDGQGKMDAKFFVDKIKTDPRYERLQLSIATDLKIEGLLVSRDITAVQEADIFECLDSHIIKTITESLMNGSLDYDTFDRVISERLNSVWYEQHQKEYEILNYSMSFLRRLDNPIPSHLLSTDYIRYYTDSYYLIDTYYRRICTNFKKLENPIMEMESLIDRVENAYQTKFLDPLGKEYSDALKEQDEWSFPGIDTTGNFYRNVQRNNYKKCFVIISDGLRYEIGHELYEKIKIDPVLKGSEEIKYAISTIPSETRFGMAALLPHQTTQYKDKAVFDDNMPTNGTKSRDAVLKAKSSSYAAITYDEINSMSRNDLRSFMADKSLVYIYHDVVDNAGEHNESKVFDVVPTAIEEILLLIRKLYNNLQISNFYVTADHGFLYRRNTIEESQKYSNVVSLHPEEASKRYVITSDASMGIPYTTEFKLTDVSDGQYKVITPYGYDLFKTQGAGLQYVHGGASLQETIVPIIHIGELRGRQNKDAVTPVGVRLKSVTRKITNRSFTLEFEQYEKVESRKQAITCETFIVDEQGKQVSGVYKFVAASESDDVDSRSTKIRFGLMNIEFDRNKRYYLVLRNAAKPDEYIEKEQFTIDILNFKLF